MGYSEDHALNALYEAGNDIEIAIELLSERPQFTIPERPKPVEAK